MDKNTVWAFILILAVFWLSSELLWKPPVTDNAEAAATEQTAQVTADNTDEPVNTSAQTDEQEKVTYQTEPDSMPDIEITNDIILSNDHVEFRFSNKGADVTDILLKDYKLSEDGETVNLLRDADTALGMQIFNFNGNTMLEKNRVYNWEMRDNSVVFISTGIFGRIEKKFTLKDEYQLELSLVIDSGLERFDYSLHLDDGIADTERYLKRKSQNYQAIAQIDNKINRENLGKLKKKKTLSGTIDWAAVRSKFFILGIVKDELSDWNRALLFSSEESPALDLFGSSSRPHFEAVYTVYAGPVIQKNLDELGSGFGVTYYAGNGIFFGQGIIKPVSRFFGWIFNQFHRVIPNWGLCLIIFSILIKIILYPLTHKSFESNQKMQKVQPLVTEVREKFKNDPQKMNAEMQRIYRENGVSPFGGCLPMLLQMPIFFALYPVIRYSIDLRQAGFLWLSDLSEPDPYLILPIVMGVFMFLQQYLMRPSKDSLEKMTEQQQAQMQSQKMMMYIMPVIMFFLFKSFPSGLVLYWTVFNIMSTAQQRIIRKKFN